VSDESQRRQLAEAQSRLVRSLVGQAPPPDGFDPVRLRLAARSLVNKRLRESARAWPMLARCLGGRYAERFRAFAALTPPPGEGGPLADGRAFARAVPLDELDGDARRELLLVDLLWRPTRLGLRPRRGFALKGARIGGRWVIGLRVPGLGARLIALTGTSPAHSR
jgi:hypothetical protein